MTQEKLTAQTPITELGGDEVLYVVDDPGGTPAQRKITRSNLGKRTVEAGITASTTQTQGQQPLTNELNQISVCATTNDTVTLPTAVAGLEVIIANDGAETLQIFPASGDNIEGAGVDTAVTLAAAGRVHYATYDATNWIAI